MTTTTDSQALSPEQLLLLLTWMSPAFPIGSFAYSHGLEWAIEDGAVGSAEALAEWIGGLIETGSGWNDAVLLTATWQSVPRGEPHELHALNELALALAPSQERHAETSNLGAAFAAAVQTMDPRLRGDEPKDDRRHPLVPAQAGTQGPQHQSAIAYPIAAGALCSAAGIPLSSSLLAYLQGFAQSLISVAVRLVPLGQSKGLEVLRQLSPLIVMTAERAARSTLDDLGSASLISDMASMKHETQYSRVFRT